MRPPAAPRPSKRSPSRRAEPAPGRPGDPAARRPAEPARGRPAEPEPPARPPDHDPPPAARVVVPRREPGEAVRRGMSSVSTGLRERIAERDAAARRLLLRRVLLAVAALAVLAGLGWLLLGSSVLALRADEVAVRGTGTTVDAAEVHAAVAPAVGTPLPRLDLGAMREEVEDITTVRSATLTREWPHGLRVDLVAREPVAAVAAEEGYVLLDPDGVQVARAGTVPDGVPEVTVPLDDGDTTARALSAVLDVLSGLPEDLLGAVSEAGARSAREVRLELDDGATVRWGSAEETELKAAVLQVLRQEPAGLYDVSVPRAPITRE